MIKLGLHESLVGQSADFYDDPVTEETFAVTGKIIEVVGHETALENNQALYDVRVEARYVDRTETTCRTILVQRTTEPTAEAIKEVIRRDNFDGDGYEYMGVRADGSCSTLRQSTTEYAYAHQWESGFKFNDKPVGKRRGTGHVLIRTFTVEVQENPPLPKQVLAPPPVNAKALHADSYRAVVQFSQDIEREVHSIFGRLDANEIGTQEMLDAIHNLLADMLNGERFDLVQVWIDRERREALRS